MTPSDPFDGALGHVEELREFYEAPIERAVIKDIGHIDELCRRLIAAAPMLFIGTQSRRAAATSARAAGRPAS